LALGRSNSIGLQAEHAGSACKPAVGANVSLKGEKVMSNQTRRYDTIVIGGGQAGLSTGYYLQKQGRDFLILDANARIGDSWRNRWDSLRLFTPARYDGLVGMPFPAPPHTFPTKNEMGDYLESYAVHFKLPVRMGVKVDSLTKQGSRFMMTAGDL
jgi:putative flavoprotein involved in K+ transport